MATTKQYEGEERDWSLLPPEVLGLIESKCNFMLIDDVNKFRVVCKGWRRAYHQKYQEGWLVQKSSDESTLKFFHPLANVDKPYCLDVPDLKHTSIHYSKDGWLLMTRDYNNDIFFFNPFTKSTITLPTLCEYDGQIYGFTCTSSPTLKNCSLFGIALYARGKYIDILTFCKGKSEWTKKRFQSDREFNIFGGNPVYHKEKFYCLTNIEPFNVGSLGVFDPNGQTWNSLNPLYDIPKNISCNRYAGYLVDSHGDHLTVVFTMRNRKPLILRLDECMSNWLDVSDLGEHVFFLSGKTCFAKMCKRHYMKNKLYLPMEYNDYEIFYCLDNGLYQTFGNDFSTKIISNETTGELLDCCWMELTQHHCNNNKEQWTHMGGLD